jgi:hypothetical protein
MSYLNFHQKRKHNMHQRNPARNQKSRWFTLSKQDNFLGKIFRIVINDNRSQKQNTKSV